MKFSCDKNTYTYTYLCLLWVEVRGLVHVKRDLVHVRDVEGVTPGKTLIHLILFVSKFLGKAKVIIRNNKVSNTITNCKR